MSAHITLAIDENLLTRVRRYAADRGTTVDTVVEAQLAALVDDESRRRAGVEALLALAATTDGRLPEGYRWNREDAYGDRVVSRHEHLGLRGGGAD